MNIAVSKMVAYICNDEGNKIHVDDEKYLHRYTSMCRSNLTLEAMERNRPKANFDLKRQLELILDILLRRLEKCGV